LGADGLEQLFGDEVVAGTFMIRKIAVKGGDVTSASVIGAVGTRPPPISPLTVIFASRRAARMRWPMPAQAGDRAQLAGAGEVSLVGMPESGWTEPISPGFQSGGSVRASNTLPLTRTPPLILVRAGRVPSPWRAAPRGC